jgi:predicted Zn-dependent protease
MNRSEPAKALDLLDHARDLGSEDNRRAFDTWRAEILSRTGRPDEAARIYYDLVASAPSASQVALDAAETFLDNGHREQARSFLKRARDLARTARATGIEDRAKRHLRALT